MPRLVDRATARDRGMLTSTGAPMVDSRSWTVSPSLGSAMFSTTWRVSGRISSWRRTSRPERRPLTLGMSIALTHTTSVHCSMAARPISGRPGAVSTTTYWNCSASCSKKTADLLRGYLVGINGGWRSAHGVDAARVDRKESLEDQRVLARGRGYRVRDGVLGVEIERGGDVAELQVQVHDHHAHRCDLAQADGDVGGDGGFSYAAFGGEDADN